MTAHWHSNEDGEVTLDTNIIRSTFRVVVQRSVVLLFINGLMYAAIFYYLASDLWTWLGLTSLISLPLFYLTGQRRSFPVFFASVLLLLVLILASITLISLKVGSHAGFQYVLIAIIPIVMVAGRIGLLAKWLLIGGLTVYILWLDKFIAAHGQTSAFTDVVIDAFHVLNLGVVSVVLGMITQRYFVLVSEYQSVIQRIASIDPLTGLLNRRHMLELADIAVAKARRFETPLSLIMCDVDHFKLVNDHHGHGAGDMVLRRVSQLLKETAREYDSVCRWGGEEFLLLLPETALENAGVIADRIRQILASTPIDIGTEMLNINITLGAAELGASELLSDALERADAALYTGKSGGRNQVVLSRPEMA